MDADPPETGDQFDRVPGWPEDVVARRVGTSYQTRITKLDMDGRGRAWLLRSERASRGADDVAVLERYSTDGALELRIPFPVGSRVPGFAVHPSGELTVLAIEPEPGTDQRCEIVPCPLTILRLSGEGGVLRQRSFVDAGHPGEAIAYDENGEGTPYELPADQRPRFPRLAHAVAVADGEGLYLVVWSIGAKLFRLDPGYDERWSVQLMPINIGMFFPMPDEIIAFDEQGNAFVSYQLFEDDVPIYAKHFNRPPLTSAGLHDVLVQGFAPDGRFLGARLFGGPGVDHPAGLTVDAGQVTVTGAARLTKYDPTSSPNRTMEWDLLIARGGLGDDEPEAIHTIDLARDDYAHQVVTGADGTLTFAGRMDYVQVDTNSEVENGKGLLLALSADLQDQGMRTLVGPRDVQVHAIRPLPDGRLLFAGIRNAPLTHTDPAETNNEGVLGIAPSLRP